jgi:hypothetical protein
VIPLTSELAPLYGPALRCKLDLNIWRVVLKLLCLALAWSDCAPGHHGYPGLDPSRSVATRIASLGHDIFAACTQVLAHGVGNSRRCSKRQT